MLIWAGSGAGGAELRGSAPKDEIEAETVAEAAGVSATGCKLLLLAPPPNLLLGGADVKSSPPGKLGMPAKGLPGALLAALLAALLGLGLLSGLVGGGGALSGSGGGSRGSAASVLLATAWAAAMLRLP